MLSTKFIIIIISYTEVIANCNRNRNLSYSHSSHNDNCWLYAFLLTFYYHLESCNAILKTDSSASDGIYTITTPSWSSQVSYNDSCLVTRFVSIGSCNSDYPLLFTVSGRRSKWHLVLKESNALKESNEIWFVSVY